MNNRYLLFVLVDKPPGDAGKPGHAQSDGGEDNRVAAKPEELVSLAGVISDVEVRAAGPIERSAAAARARRIRGRVRGVDAVTGMTVAGVPAGPPTWAQEMCGQGAPQPPAPGRRTENRQSLGALAALLLAEPGVLEARRRITLLMRRARLS